MGNRHSLEYQQTGLGFADLTTKEGKEELNIASRVQLRNTVKKLVVELKVRHGVIALLENLQVTDHELESKDCFSHQVRIVSDAINAIKDLKIRVEDAEECNRKLRTEIDEIRQIFSKVSGLGQDYKNYIKRLESQIQELQREIFCLNDSNKKLKNELSKKGQNTEKCHSRNIRNTKCNDCEYLKVEMELLKLNEILQPDTSTDLQRQLDNVMKENQYSKTIERKLAHQLKEKCSEVELLRHKISELEQYFTESKQQKQDLQLELKEQKEQMEIQINQLQCELKEAKHKHLNATEEKNSLSEKLNEQEAAYNDLVVQMVDDYENHTTGHTEQCCRIKELEEQIAECNTARQCVVCLERRRCVAYMPCKHLATCEQCDRRLSQRICPIDRTQIKESVKIFNT